MKEKTQCENYGILLSLLSYLAKISMVLLTNLLVSLVDLTKIS